MAIHPIYAELQAMEERGQYTETITRTEEIIAAHPPESGDVAYGYALISSAYAYHTQFEFTRAIQLSDQAIAYAEKNNFDHLLAVALIYKNIFLSYYIGSEDTRYKVRERAMRISEHLKDQKPYVYALASQAAYFGAVGNMAEFDRLMTQAESIVQTHGLDDVMININVWKAQYKDIPYKEKLDLTQQALDRATECQNLTTRLYCLLTRSLIMMENYFRFSGKDAIATVEQCAQESESLGHLTRQAEALYLLGNFYVKNNHFTDGIPPLEKALSFVPADIDLSIYSVILVQLVFAYFSNKDYEKMLEYEEQLEYLAMFIRDDVHNKHIYLGLALAQATRGRYQRVNHYFAKAREYSQPGERLSLMFMQAMALVRCTGVKIRGVFK